MAGYSSPPIMPLVLFCLRQPHVRFPRSHPHRRHFPGPSQSVLLPRVKRNALGTRGSGGDAGRALASPGRRAGCGNLPPSPSLRTEFKEMLPKYKDPARGGASACRRANMRRPASPDSCARAGEGRLCVAKSRPRSARACAPGRSAEPREPRPRRPGARRPPATAAAAAPAGIHVMARRCCLTLRGRAGAGWGRKSRRRRGSSWRGARGRGSDESPLREPEPGATRRESGRGRTQTRRPSRPRPQELSLPGEACRSAAESQLSHKQVPKQAGASPPALCSPRPALQPFLELPYPPGAGRGPPSHHSPGQGPPPPGPRPPRQPGSAVRRAPGLAQVSPRTQRAAAGQGKPRDPPRCTRAARTARARRGVWREPALASPCRGSVPPHPRFHAFLPAPGACGISRAPVIARSPPPTPAQRPGAQGAGICQAPHVAARGVIFHFPGGHFFW